MINTTKITKDEPEFLPPVSETRVLGVLTLLDNNELVYHDGGELLIGEVSVKLASPTNVCYRHQW